MKLRPDALKSQTPKNAIRSTAVKFVIVVAYSVLLILVGFALFRSVRVSIPDSRASEGSWKAPKLVI